MSRTIRIKIVELRDAPDFSRFKNFGEDVWRYCRDTKHANVTLQEVDTSTDTLMLQNVRSRMVRHVCADVEVIANRHYFSGEKVNIGRVDELD